MQLTEKIAAFVAETDYTNIPEPALEQAKTGIMDWIFVSLAGARMAGGSIRNFTELIMSQGGREESTIIGAAGRTTENQAALINGCIGHAMDYDETCPKVRSHLFASIFPALSAASEHRRASGKQMLTGFITGHEVAMRVGEAITPASSITD